MKNVEQQQQQQQQRHPGLYDFTIPQIVDWCLNNRQQARQIYDQSTSREALEAGQNNIVTISTRSVFGEEGTDLFRFAVHTGSTGETLSGDRVGRETWKLCRWTGGGDYSDDPETSIYCRNAVPDKEAKAVIIDFIGNCLALEFSANNIHQQRLNAWLECDGDYAPSPIKYENIGTGGIFQLFGAMRAGRS